jgi:hypothetical protein
LFASLGTLNPDVLLELFSIYREWQEKKAKEMSQKQVRFSVSFFFLHLIFYDLDAITSNIIRYELITI